jgi:alpha-L-fucosidase 2
MFVQNYQGVTRLFPNWPRNRDAKFVRLRTKGAFVLSAEQRGGVIQSVDVVSEKGNRFTMANPLGGAVKITDTSGFTVAHANADKVISFPTSPGQTYRLTG